MNYLIQLSTLIVLGLCTPLYGQTEVEMTGKARMRQEMSMSSNEAKSAVINLAKVNAIESAFGTYIEQENISRIENDKSSFNTIGTVRVKGEWIKTIGEPQVSFKMIESNSADNPMPEIWWTCTIKGLVREMSAPDVSYDAFSLIEPEKKFESSKFRNGDSFYYYFKSPNNGFFALFLEFEGTVYRMLPYQEMNGEYLSALPIKADKEYIFFDPEKNYSYYPDFPDHLVDEMQMGTELEEEVDLLYVVFSQQPFGKPMLNESATGGSLTLPKSVSTSRFQGWLRDNKAFDGGFSYTKQQIIITKD